MVGTSQRQIKGVFCLAKADLTARTRRDKSASQELAAASLPRSMIFAGTTKEARGMK